MWVETDDMDLVWVHSENSHYNHVPVVPCEAMLEDLAVYAMQMLHKVHLGWYLEVSDCRA